jgi:hypothetical protein
MRTAGARARANCTARVVLPTPPLVLPNVTITYHPVGDDFDIKLMRCQSACLRPWSRSFSPRKATRWWGAFGGALRSAPRKQSCFPLGGSGRRSLEAIGCHGRFLRAPPLSAGAGDSGYRHEAINRRGVFLACDAVRQITEDLPHAPPDQAARAPSQAGPKGRCRGSLSRPVCCPRLAARPPPGASIVPG